MTSSEDEVFSEEKDPSYFYQKKYVSTEKGKEAHRAYFETPEGVEAQKRYQKSEKGYLSRKRYRMSDKGKSALGKYQGKFEGMKLIAERVRAGVCVVCGSEIGIVVENGFPKCLEHSKTLEACNDLDVSSPGSDNVQQTPEGGA